MPIFSGIEYYPSVTSYGAFRNSGLLGRGSLLPLSAVQNTSGAGGAALTDRGAVLDYSVGATTIASAYSRTYPGGTLGGIVAATKFSKPFRVLIPAVEMANNVDTTGRIIFGGTAPSNISAIDNTDWGIELSFVAGSCVVRACNLAGTVQVATGFAFSNGQSFEVVHDPAVGLTVLKGDQPGAMAVAATIAFGASYPVADSLDTFLRTGIDRVVGAGDTTTRHFYCSRIFHAQYNGG